MIGIGLAIIGVALIFALTQTSNTQPIPFLPPIDTPSNVQHFTSEKDILLAFQNSMAQSGFSGRGMMDGALPQMGGNITKATSEAASGSAGGAGAPSAAPNYSNTNVQVQGVDEADIVKTDGKYIYSFYRNRLVITKAYPAESMEIVKQLTLENISPQQMFINGDKLILFGSKYENVQPAPYDSRVLGTAEGISSSSGASAITPSKIAAPGIGGDMMIYPPYWGYSKSIVYVYNVSDHSNPTLEKQLEFTGNYVSGRMIDNIVYFVMTSYPDYRILSEGSGGGSIIPMMKEDGVEAPIARAQDIGYIAPIYAQQFITLGSLDLDTEKVNRKTIVGNAENVYASADNLYVTHTIWNYWQPIPIGTEVNPDDLPEKVSDSFQKTVVYKFALNHGNVDYKGYASVPGHVLNQFSMDEYNGNVRIATTIDQQWDFMGRVSNPSTNNVYVLNEDMDIVGRLEDLAKGESIYSARFIENRGYLVTFKKVDPLFVIDLSNPEKPIVVGKLKIPGYSDYLHPLDATHIIGVGKDAIPSKEGDFAWYQGMKLAVFDVSDVENPVQQHSIIIGDRGTDSYALQDHKAFLYDKEKELLVLPIYLYEITDEVKQQYQDQAKQRGADWRSFPAYGVPTFQGAFVYHLNLEDGFVEKGRITHVSKEIDLKSGYYYDWEYQVQRSLFIDNTLFTVSQAKIKANDLDTMKEISSVEFPRATGEFTFNYSTSENTYSAGTGIGSGSNGNMSITKDKAIIDLYLYGLSYANKHGEFDDSSYYDKLAAAFDWDAWKNYPEYTETYPTDYGKSYTSESVYLTVTNGDFTEYRNINPDLEKRQMKSFWNAMDDVYHELADKAKVVEPNYGYGYGYGYGGGVVTQDSAVPPTTVDTGN